MTTLQYLINNHYNNTLSENELQQAERRLIEFFEILMEIDTQQQETTNLNN